MNRHLRASELPFSMTRRPNANTAGTDSTAVEGSHSICRSTDSGLLPNVAGGLEGCGFPVRLGRRDGREDLSVVEADW